MVIKVRMTEELYGTILATAEHVKLKPAEVLQIICRSYLNGRPVAQINTSQTYYKPGRRVVSIRKVPLPIVADDEFRKYIYRRCQEEREKKVRIFRSYAVEAGISSRPPETLEEAKQMACYYDKKK